VTLSYKPIIQAYNVGKSEEEQLRALRQEDAAPVFNFLLGQGKAKEVALYSTKVHPQGKYVDTTNEQPSTGTALPLPLPEAPAPITMDQLVAYGLRGNHATEVVWEQPEGKPAIRDEAFIGNKLSLANLHGLHSGILPVCVHRFRQRDNLDATTARKINTLITHPFSFTIPQDHLVEEAPYTAQLVGFIHHAGEEMHEGALQFFCAFQNS
jgi:hypothetical protein